MTPRKLSEQTLLRLINSEDESQNNIAATCMRITYRESVQYLTSKLSGQCVEPEHILNDAVLIVMRAVRKGAYDSNISQLKTYFLAIARRLVLMELRKNRRRSDNHAKYVLFWERLENHAQQAPDYYFLLREQAEQLWAAINELNEPCRDLIIRYWMKGEYLTDIAKLMNIKEVALKKRHERCRKKLKALLDERLKDKEVDST